MGTLNRDGVEVMDIWLWIYGKWIYGYGSVYMDPTGSNEIQVETNVISFNVVELVKRTGFDIIRLGTSAYEKWIYLFDTLIHLT